MGEGTNTTQPRAIERFTIKRPRLTALLDGSGARILLLLAPAGYGKTTLAREWIDGREGAIWYAGGAAMGDVAALAVGVARALTRDDEVADRVRILAARGQPGATLAKAVAAAAPRDPGIVLAVDDYHFVAESEDADAFMAELLGLTEFRLLLTSRMRPSWLTPRMTVYGEATVLETDALAFTDEEAQAVLGINGKKSPAAIVSQARGWPAVIGLAAVRGSVNGVKAGLKEEELYEYFAADLFEAVSPEFRSALFLLALGGDASATTARELLGRGYEAIVTEASERGFLARDSEGWASFHPLLRTFLLSRFRELEPTEVDLSVRRVVGCLAGSKCWDSCLTALQRFPLHDLVMTILCDAPGELLSFGRIATLRQWLKLATDCGLKHPVILLAEAEIALRERDLARAQTLGESAGKLFGEGELAGQAHLLAARAAHLADNASGVASNCDRALALSTDAEVRFEAVRIASLNAIERESPEATALLEQLDDLNPGRPDHELAVALARGILALERGRIHDAERLLEAKAPLLSHAQDPLIRTSFLNAYANVAVALARYDLTLDLAGIQARDAEAAGLDFALDYALVHRARAQIGLRRILSAQRTLQELGSREALLTPHVFANALMQHIRLRIARGDLAGASVIVERQVATCISDGAQGEVAAYRGLILAAQGELDRAAEALRQATGKTALVDAAAFSALGLAVLSLQRGEGGEATAVPTLQRVMSQGYRDAVVTACRAYPELARAGASDPELIVPLTALFVASRDIDLGRQAGLKMPRELRPREDLSPRERDVYELLAQGRSNRDIARTLFISESTTKVHVRHIFEKLGVRTRAEAAIAGVRGLSGPAERARTGP